MKEFGLPWIAHLLLFIFLGFWWGGIIRLARGKILFGILYIVTFGLFSIGWIIDIVTMIVHKDITVLA